MPKLHTILQVNGSLLVISNIKDMIHTQLAHANQMLESLCEDMDMLEYDICLKKHLDPIDPAGWPKDPLHKHTHKYSFINYPDNPFFAFKHDPMRKIVESPQIFETYHIVDSNGYILFKQGKSLP